MIACCLALAMTGSASPSPNEGPVSKPPTVTVMRVPNEGVQPDAVVDQAGAVHLVYLAGQAKASNVYLVTSSDGGRSFSEPMQVNSLQGSAVAVSGIRGPHLALGREGRAHVLWIGPPLTKPAPGKHAPPTAVYARMKADQGRFEEQRVLSLTHDEIDGGASVAADGAGRVWVTWHAPETHGGGEPDRRVWVMRSDDDGDTFSAEKPAARASTGACGCCNMRSFATGAGDLLILYRSADKVVHRDTYLLRSADRGESFTLAKLHEWNVGQCVMSTASFAAGGQRVVAAWETREQVYWAAIDPAGALTGEPVAAPDKGRNRKHPAIAVNAAGQVALAWTEGTTWGKGGSIAWQVFDRDGKPLASTAGRADDLPVWGKPAVFAAPDGSFVVMY